MLWVLCNLVKNNDNTVKVRKLSLSLKKVLKAHGLNEYIQYFAKKQKKPQKHRFSEQDLVFTYFQDAKLFHNSANLWHFP